MSRLILSRAFFPRRFLRSTGEYIASVQLPSGGIPWQTGGLLDPWDHVESAMGLAVCGFLPQAERAFAWLTEQQNPDGSYWPAYVDRTPLDTTRKETHHAAYPATGVWHSYLLGRKRAFLERMWPTVQAGLDFACARQSAHGEIAWALKPDGSTDQDALITGCSSIYKSLECGLNIAAVLGQNRPDWLIAREELGRAIAEKPERFDRTWPSKARYSMDWFYPVLCGVLSPGRARERLKDKWKDFIEEGLGCRCVLDEPWVTVAETCELVLALLAAGERAKATQVFGWLQHNRDPDGAYWTGYQTELDLYWPDEKPTWTAAAVLLAADGLAGVTPASALFIRSEEAPPWQEEPAAAGLRQASI